MNWRERIAFLGMLALAGCGDDDGVTPGPDAGGRDAAMTEPDASCRCDSGTPGTDGGVPATDAGPPGMGGAAYRGELFFTEGFEAGDFPSRGWYDDSPAVLSDTEHMVGASSFECRFAPGAMTCPGRPGRHMIPDANSVYLSFWVKYSASWVG